MATKKCRLKMSFYSLDDEGKIELTPTEISAKVYEKIYLDLQQDEVELSTKSFRELYHSLLSIYNEQKPLVMETFLQELSAEQIDIGEQYYHE